VVYHSQRHATISCVGRNTLWFRTQARERTSTLRFFSAHYSTLLCTAFLCSAPLGVAFQQVQRPTTANAAQPWHEEFCLGCVYYSAWTGVRTKTDRHAMMRLVVGCFLPPAPCRANNTFFGPAHALLWAFPRLQSSWFYRAPPRHTTIFLLINNPPRVRTLFSPRLERYATCLASLPGHDHGCSAN
jgi:hypothetical protein